MQQNEDTTIKTAASAHQCKLQCDCECVCAYVCVRTQRESRDAGGFHRMLLVAIVFIWNLVNKMINTWSPWLSTTVLSLLLTSISQKAQQSGCRDIHPCGAYWIHFKKANGSCGLALDIDTISLLGFLFNTKHSQPSTHICLITANN